MLFLCRMDCLPLDGLLAMAQPDQETMKKWRWPLVMTTACLLLVSVETFLLGGGTFDGHIERTIGYSLFDLACLAFIMSVLSLRGTAATAWLNWRPLQFIGMISYAVFCLKKKKKRYDRLSAYIHLKPGQPCTDQHANARSTKQNTRR